MNEIEKEFIPVNDIKLSELEIKYAEDALKTGFISGLAGKYIKMFEDKCAEFCNAKYGVACSNGTTALHLAVRVAGIKNGDEVLVNTFTNIPTVLSIMWNGGTPVLVDSRKDTWAMDEKDIEDKITEKTKAIMPVHIYGHPCDMDPILKLAKEHDIYVVEDAAEAHGAEYKGKPVGNFSDISCYSYYGNKIITTGEGGMCLTNDDELADLMRVLRNQGTKPEYKNKYYYDMIGYNYRITNMQAAVGVAQLKRIDYLVDKRIEMARIYDEIFESRSRNIIHAPKMEWAKNTYWYYSILVPKGTRDKVVAALENKEIESRPFFYPIHMLPHYNIGEKLPVAEDIGFRGLNLPSGPQLTQDQIEEVAKEIINMTG